MSGIVYKIFFFKRLLSGRIHSLSKRSLRESIEEQSTQPFNECELEFRKKNRQIGDDQIATALSAFYAKLIVVLGIAFPVTDVIGVKAPIAFYQGFYLYLYIISVSFVAFMYFARLRCKRAEKMDGNLF